jgi:hypothetical protein
LLIRSLPGLPVHPYSNPTIKKTCVAIEIKKPSTIADSFCFIMVGFSYCFINGEVYDFPFIPTRIVYLPAGSIAAFIG